MYESLEEVSYLIPRDFSYHLSEIGKGLVDSLILLLEKKEVSASEFLKKLARVEIHFENLSLLRREIGSFRKKYETMRDRIKEEYSRDLKTPLKPNDYELLQIELAELLEHVYSLITTGLGTLPNPSTLIYARTFPEKVKAKIGKDEVVVDRAFTIGRLDDDYIGIRRVPFQMSLKELAKKAGSDSEINRFPILFKSREKIERKAYQT
ncbi:MAG: hypothetical protein ACP5QI_06725, partial [Candidatus Bathyarchaeia archaeon]